MTTHVVITGRAAALGRLWHDNSPRWNTRSVSSASMSAALRALDSRLPVDILIAKLLLKRMAAASV